MSRLALAVTAILIQGCAFVPQVNHRIEEVKRVQVSVLSQTEVATLAPAEWSRASEAVDTAVAAWATHQDAAVVDHLAYVARQRIEIARETARRVAAESAIETARRTESPRKVSLQR